ncbi:MAG: hypothetical protein U1F43_20555 [Myxococcota bacterium]
MGWVVLAPDGAGFRMELPVEPELVTKPVTGPTGLATTLRQWNASDAASGTVLVVAIAPLVQQLVEHGDSAMALDRSIRALEKPGLHLGAITSINVDGFAGREADLKVSAGDEGEAEGKVRLFIIGYRLYQAMGIWSDESGQTQVLKALGSLHFDADAAALETHPVDLWRRVDAPFGALDVELPGTPEATTETHDTAFGKLEVQSLTLVSSFPPAAYGLNAATLADADADLPPAKLLDRWAASLDPKPKKVERRTVLGNVPARFAVGDIGAWLAFVYDGRFYELLWQPIDQGAGKPKAGDTERNRWLESPRAKTP